MLTILPVRGLPDIGKGDNLANMIVTKFGEDGEKIQQGDIIVIAQKVVSKAEGRVISLTKVQPSPFAKEIAVEAGKDPRHVELILRESKKIIRMGKGHL